VFGELADVEDTMIFQGASEINSGLSWSKKICLRIVRRLHKTFSDPILDPGKSFALSGLAVAGGRQLATSRFFGGRPET